MAYQGNLLSKTLVIGIIILFIVMSIIPSVAIDTVNFEHANGKSSSDNIDWWPMFHHDLENSGYSSSPDAPETNNVLWSYKANDWITSSAAIVNDKVYFGSFDEVFYCLNARTGAIIWSQSIPGGTSTGSPCVVDGRVYMGTSYDHFFCWDADTGEEIWRFYKVYGACHSPAISDGKVFFTRCYLINYSYYALVQCLDVDTGAEIWTKHLGEGVSSHVAVYNGKVYADNHYWGILYCLDGETGDTIWEKVVGGDPMGPAIANGKVYIGAKGIMCLDAITGEEIWYYQGKETSCSPAVAYDRVYYTSTSDGKIICLDADDGDEVWVYDIGSEYEHSVASPAVADGKVYTGIWSYGWLLCLNASTGEFVWYYPVSPGSPGHLFSSPAIADGRVYMGGSTTFTMYCFEDNSGPPSNPVINGPTNGKAGIEYNYTFYSVDPDDNDVYYFIDWGDTNYSGWIGPKYSGEDTTISHVWEEEGTYTIGAKAKDSFGDESDWTDFDVKIEIPRSRAVNRPLLLQLLFDRFPLLEVFLRAMNLLR